jgi:hypothetical protein
MLRIRMASLAFVALALLAATFPAAAAAAPADTAAAAAQAPSTTAAAPAAAQAPSTCGGAPPLLAPIVLPPGAADLAPVADPLTRTCGTCSDTICVGLPLNAVCATHVDVVYRCYVLSTCSVGSLQCVCQQMPS